MKNKKDRSNRRRTAGGETTWDQGTKVGKDWGGGGLKNNSRKEVKRKVDETGARTQFRRKAGGNKWVLKQMDRKESRPVGPRSFLLAASRQPDGKDAWISLPGRSKDKSRENVPSKKGCYPKRKKIQDMDAASAPGKKA